MPVPSDHLDVAVVTKGKYKINTVRFLTKKKKKKNAPFVS